VRIRLTVLLLLCVLLVPGLALAVPTEEIDLSYLEEATRVLREDLGELLPNLDAHALLEAARGAEGIDWRGFLGAVFSYFFREVVAGSRLLGQLLLLVVLVALLATLERSFSFTGAARIAETIVFIAIMGFAIQSLNLALGTGRTAITNMVSFMQALLPVLFTLLAATGAMTTAAVFHPLLMMTIAVVGTITQDFIFPLLYLATVLHLVTYLVPEMNVGRLASLLQGICTSLLGLALCIFVGFSAGQGATSHVADGITIRSAKFLAGSFVPVVGKLFADALEAVVGYTALLRTAVNAVGIFLILLMCAFPLLKILALIFIYKLAAALAEPIGDARMAKCLGNLGNSLAFVFATVGAVALLFFLALTVILGVGNLATLAR
jgi:stage III sporulation protein AE